MKQPRLPLPPVDARAAALACTARMNPEGRQRTEAFWKERKTNDTASAQ